MTDTNPNPEASVPDPPDALVAAVLSAGIWLGLVERHDVIAWADHCIEKTEQPPNWMIDLSLSHDLHVVDLVRLLDQIGQGVDPVETCRCVYGLVPDPTDLSFDSAERLADDLYQIARHCLNADWSHALLCEADQIHDNFALIRDGFLDCSEQEVVSEVRRLLDANRNPVVRDFLRGLSHP